MIRRYVISYLTVYSNVVESSQMLSNVWEKFEMSVFFFFYMMFLSPKHVSKDTLWWKQGKNSNWLLQVRVQLIFYWNSLSKWIYLQYYTFILLSLLRFYRCFVFVSFTFLISIAYKLQLSGFWNMIFVLFVTQVYA